MFQHFLLKEEVSSATIDLILCLLELMKKFLLHELLLYQTLLTGLG